MKCTRMPFYYQIYEKALHFALIFKGWVESRFSLFSFYETYNPEFLLYSVQFMKGLKNDLV